MTRRLNLMAMMLAGSVFGLAAPGAAQPGRPGPATTPLKKAEDEVERLREQLRDAEAKVKKLKEGKDKGKFGPMSKGGRGPMGWGGPPWARGGMGGMGGMPWGGRGGWGPWGRGMEKSKDGEKRGGSAEGKGPGARLDELEKKLDRLTQAIEELRRSLPGAPGGRGMERKGPEGPRGGPGRMGPDGRRGGPDRKGPEGGPGPDRKRPDTRD